MFPHVLDTDECSLNNDGCSSSQTCLNTKGSYLCIPNTCPSNYRRERDGPNGKQWCIQQCSLQPTRRCSDGARIAQTISHSVVSVPAFDVDMPILKLVSYDLDRRPLTLTYFTFDDRHSGDVFVLDTSPRKPGVALIYAKENVPRDKLQTIAVMARSFGDDGSLLYITKYVVHVYVG